MYQTSVQQGRPQTSASVPFDRDRYGDGYAQPQGNDVEGQREPVDKQALGNKLAQELGEAMSARTLYEQRWLADLRQYKGVYDPSIMTCMKHDKRSTVYYRLTTQKVNTMVARLMDLLFPQRTKNWSIAPTPDPNLPQDVLVEDMQDEIAQAMMAILQPQIQQMKSQGIVPDQLAAQKISEQAYTQAVEQLYTPENIQRVASTRAKRMETLIDDSLKECNANGQRRPSWAQNCRSVVHDCCLYGMGVLKGPLVEQVSVKRFQCSKNENGILSWKESVFSTDLRPYHEAVSIWDIFPDPDARDPSEMRYVWQCHMMTDKDVIALKSFPGFDAAEITRYLKDAPDGDANLSSWESQLRNLDSEANGSTKLMKRYRVWERWGFLTGKELREAGADIPEDRDTRVYSSNVWMIGDSTIIKAMVNPLEGVDIPYYWYPYSRDDSTFWPEGIASLLRSPQAGINAAVRAMQDNAALASRPFLAFNMQALSADDAAHLSDAMARGMLRFDGAGITLPQAFQAVTIPSCISENLTQQQFWSNAADEISTPRFNAGDGNVSGAGKTASGLSMLMGASNILLKDHIKIFDDNVIAPFIRAMYRWLMQWSPREDCKGDFEVVASGSQSLIAKEVRAQQVPGIMQWLGIPAFQPHINTRGLLEVAFEQTDLPVERILYSPEEAERNQRDQEMANAQANVQALMQELQKQGLPPEEIQKQLFMLLAQLTSQTGGPASLAAASSASAAPSAAAIEKE